MLFKISLSNIRKSLKDYAVYFFTLVVGVAVFYVFNAIETQTAFLNVSEDHREFIKFLVPFIIITFVTREFRHYLVNCTLPCSFIQRRDVLY